MCCVVLLFADEVTVHNVVTGENRQSDTHLVKQALKLQTLAPHTANSFLSH